MQAARVHMDVVHKKIQAEWVKFRDERDAALKQVEQQVREIREADDKAVREQEAMCKMHADAETDMKEWYRKSLAEQDHRLRKIMKDLSDKLEAEKGELRRDLAAATGGARDSRADLRTDLGRLGTALDEKASQLAQAEADKALLRVEADETKKLKGEQRRLDSFVILALGRLNEELVAACRRLIQARLEAERKLLEVVAAPEAPSIFRVNQDAIGRRLEKIEHDMRRRGVMDSDLAEAKMIRLQGEKIEELEKLHARVEGTVRQLQRATTGTGHEEGVLAGHALALAEHLRSLGQYVHGEQEELAVAKVKEAVLSLLVDAAQ